MDYIFQSFPITNEEWQAVDDRYGKLAHYAAWQLVRKNVNNHHANDPEDIAQEIRLACMRAISYYKRQTYIEASLVACRAHGADPKAVNRLERLWKQRTLHGAARQRFGLPQEQELDLLLARWVPINERPRKTEPLDIEGRFGPYVKCIIWNAVRHIGKQITREKAILAGSVSLSNFEAFDSQFS